MIYFNLHGVSGTIGKHSMDISRKADMVPNMHPADPALNCCVQLSADTQAAGHSSKVGVRNN